jgi:formamidopyrimidine-DNA glycosylase
MPELPEVETMRRGLLPAIGGTIERVEFPTIPYRPIGISPPAAQWPELLVGRKVVEIQRIAKRVLIVFDEEHRQRAGLRLVLQPKMAGIAMIDEPPTQAHTRLILHLKNAQCERILYWDRRGLGTAHLWTIDQCAENLGPAVLGPDALTVNAEEFTRTFRALRREVKPALLEQRYVAGVGNLYAAEILHRCGVHPQRRCDRITKRTWREIHGAMQAILNDAIVHEGSTLRDGTYRNAINGEGGYQNQHRVYDRAGELCPSCKVGLIERIVQGQRSTFFCKVCQPRQGA